MEAEDIKGVDGSRAKVGGRRKTIISRGGVMQYESFKEMLRDMYGFLKRHDGEPKIICADDPRRLTVGFMCYETEEYWCIPISRLRRAFANKYAPYKKLLLADRQGFIDAIKRRAKNASL
jgi:hypothetical protein